MLTVALAKGRLEGEALRRFARAGARLRGNGTAAARGLVTETRDGALRFLSVKPVDVATYVEHGIADLGVVGFGHCRLVVAAPAGSRWVKRYEAGLRVGTEYPRVTRHFFEGRGVPVEIIELTGSVELAPRVGLADLVVDLVETGETLRANGLVVSAEILRSSARLIVNRASHKVRLEAVREWVDRLRKGGGRAQAR